MAVDSDAFDAVAEKLATVQKLLVALVAAAVCFAVADLISGRQAARELEREAQEVRAFALAAEEVGARLRFMLSHAYPDRTLGERQRLTLLINDIRRVRRLLESESGVDGTLMKYKAPVLDATEGDPSRKSIQHELSRLRQLIYFNGPQPGGDGPGTNLFVDVGINDLNAESAINQQPVVHVAVLLLGALSLPNELANGLDAFVEKADPLRRDELIALQRVLSTTSERSHRLDSAFANTGKSSSAVAQKLLDEYVKRDGAGADGKSDDTAVRATKYSAPSLDALNQLLTDVRLAYYSEMSKARGVRAVEVPGTSIQLPGYFFLLSLPAILIVLLCSKRSLARRGREVAIPAKGSLTAAEVKYGYLVLRLMGVRASQGHTGAVVQILFVSIAPIAVAVPLAIARGWWTLWLSLPCALAVLWIESRLARKSVSRNAILRDWPLLSEEPTV